MSYYSNVAIECDSVAFEKIKGAWESVDFSPTKIIPVADGQYVLFWEYVQWNIPFDKSGAVIAVLDALDNDETAGYKMLAVGEDNTVTKRNNESGSEFEGFSVSIRLPEPVQFQLKTERFKLRF